MDAKSRKNDESRRQREWSDATDKARQAKQTLENQQTKLAEQQKAVRQLLIRVATLQFEFQQIAQAWADLQERNRLRDAGEDSLDLIRAKTQSQKLVESLQQKQAQLVQHQLAQSERKANIQRLTALLAERLLGEPGYGRFVADSDHQPFNLSQGGEAYQVLEVLLGDLACLLDGVTSTESQHPGFVVHDCPREADMSSILYANFLQAAQEAEVQLAYEGSVPFQYIVTTTSAPPRSMSKEPYAVLTLRPGHKDQLLFKRQLKQGLS